MTQKTKKHESSRILNENVSFLRVLYYGISLVSFPLICLLVIPWMLFKKSWNQERLGLLSKDKLQFLENAIWLHGASVGEVNVLLPLIHEYQKQENVKLFVTTMSTSGQKYLLEKTKEYQCKVMCSLLPLDFWLIWRFLFRRAKPQKIIIAETELWPSLFFEAKRARIPLVIVNGRISDKSYQNYLRSRFLFQQILRCVEKVYAQTLLDQSRFIEIGGDAEKIIVMGNLKNDGLSQWLEKKVEPLEIFKETPYVVFGSLRPKEIDFFLNFVELIIEKKIPLKVIVAPRHFDWMTTLAEHLAQKGIFYQMASKDGLALKDQSVQVFVMDQIGYLQRAYQGARMAFVGGTLVAEYGGHNCLEPAALGTPVFHGPYFADQLLNTNALLNAGASKIVKEAQELLVELEKLLESKDFFQTQSRKCIDVVVHEVQALALLRKENFFVLSTN